MAIVSDHKAPGARARLLLSAAVLLLTVFAGCAPIPRTVPPQELGGALSSDQPGYAPYLRGRQMEQAGDLPAAIKNYLEAATVDPDQPQILTALGLAYLQTGDHRTARMHLERAVTLGADSHRIRMGLGYAALQRADYREAVTQLERSVALEPNVRNRFLLAEALEKSERIGEALALYRQVAADDRWGKLGQAAARRVERLESRQ